MRLTEKYPNAYMIIMLSVMALMGVYEVYMKKKNDANQ
jgi:hypothetical protein